MGRYSVRVELRGVEPEGAEYEKLHALMEAEGFSRVVRGDSGRAYRLPPGEYDLDAEHSKELVCVIARSAAEQVAPKFSVLVTKMGSRVWFGLEGA